MDWKTQYEELQWHVKKLETENHKLRRELLRLINQQPVTTPKHPSAQTINQYSPPNEKIRLFRKLFRGREDVFARRWYSFNSGKSGYAPVCENDFYYKLKTSHPKNDQRIFTPLTDQIIYEHLSGTDSYGRDVVGIYPISKDDTCFFLAIDFDDGNWQDNVTSIRQICEELTISCAIERSRSGAGAHVWIFFSEPVACATARQLGSLLLTTAMEKGGELAMSSYDRMFPCQDTLPKGGFGNLIALPLQGQARKSNNSIFIDSNFLPYTDQWAYLAQIERISAKDLANILQPHSHNDILGELYNTKSDQEPWKKSEKCPLTPEDFHGTLHVTKANMLFIPQNKLSPRAKNQLIRLAAFRNPDFYKSQAMRLPVYNKPRIINITEERDGYLALPRGCETQLIELFKAANLTYEIEDKTCLGKSLSVDFCGNLRTDQIPAANSLLEHDNGILAATTAFGKTVIAAYLISQRKVNTLVLVHTQALLNQWKQSLGDFLQFNEALPEPLKRHGRKHSPSFIGQLGGNKNSLTGIIDIAIIRSLLSNDQIKDLVKDYGMVIVDECHHASALSFERVLKEVNARYVYGLTATPNRRDGHHPVAILLCGPIRYQVSAKAQAKKRGFAHTVIPRLTAFAQPLDEQHPWTITNVYQAIQQNEERNTLIITDVIDALSHGKTPLILTERYDHAQLLYQNLFKKSKSRYFVVRSRDGKRETRDPREAESDTTR